MAGNIAATVVLAGGRREDLNLEGALRHSAADALGSIGVVVAGAFVLFGGSAIVDPIVGLAIAALVLASSWRLIKEPIEVLMEAAPEGLDVDELGAAICSQAGVRSVHDLHVWTVTPGFGALSAHVVVAEGSDRDLALRSLEVMLHDRFELDHTTLQIEEEASQELLEVRRSPEQGSKCGSLQPLQLSVTYCLREAPRLRHPARVIGRRLLPGGDRGDRAGDRARFAPR